MAATGVLASRLYTSATALTNIQAAADTIGDFQGLTIATELGLIDTFGELGKVFDTVPFTDVATGRTYKLKGAFNNGQFQLGLAQDLTDSGQAALKSYVVSNQATYPFKITWSGADASYDTVYFGAKVMSFRTVMGGANSVLRATIMLEIDTDIFVGSS